MKRLLLIAVVVVGLPFLLVLILVSKSIEEQSLVDEAQKADVIVVLGAAKYGRTPSPVFKARLDHAYTLWNRGLAPFILTTGGTGGDEYFTEGQIGRDYLVAKGVPSESLLVEGEGDSTVHSVLAVAEIMRRSGLEAAVVVSDGYHIFRVKHILADAGMTVYGSPRPDGQPNGWRKQWLYVRQAFAYLLWRIGINV
jgi:uncharacterized SAM-binding protein YcdF (DUF218 family)